MSIAVSSLLCKYNFLQELKNLATVTTIERHELGLKERTDQV